MENLIMFSKKKYSLFEQKQNGVLCDVKVSLEDSVVMGHACVLFSCSRYFRELLQSSWSSELNWQERWCVRKPLVVDLNKSITDKCMLCVSKIIDFMYTSEIVVVKGHSEHFSKIVNILGVFDLFSFCSKYFTEGKPEIVCKNPEIAKSFTKVDLKTSKKASEVQESKVIPDKEHQPSIEKITNCFESVPKCVTGASQTKPLVDGTFDSKVCITNSNKALRFCNQSVGNRGKVEQQQSCEFPCCTADYDTPVSHGKQHKRKMFCEVCAHTATSVRNMVKHIENFDHFGTVCPICKMKTEALKSLQIHLKDHCDPKPYLCPICNKRNTFWEYHKLHLKSHCRNKQFHCEVCRKRFKRRQNFIEHLKSHKKDYVCNICNCLFPDTDSLKSHLFEHEENIKSKFNEIQKSESIDNNVPKIEFTKNKISKDFFCQICNKGFTKKKNLLRHTEITHYSVQTYNCSKCAYQTKRTDLLRHHMIKHHNSQPSEIEKLTQSIKKKNSKTLKPGDISKIVGVMIPVQLVSTENDSTTLNAFAVKAYENDNLQLIKNNNKGKSESDENIKISSVISGVFHSKLSHPSEPNCLQEVSFETTNKLVSAPPLSVEKKSLLPSATNNDVNHLTLFKSKSSEAQNADSEVLSHPQEVSNLHFVLEKGNNMSYESNVLTKDGNLLLNEVTGEFLCNVQVLDTSFTTPSSDTTDPLQSLILSGASTGITVYDFEKDIDQFQSNPQTPQANVVELDDSDNLLPWNCLDNSFYSTWVLNEATGELNMVSFSVLPLKPSDELQLDENTGMLSAKDDDETALFLNEGTGDLSIIYFNPNHSSVEQINQENCEAYDNVSEHSNDNEDLLNEEFFQATASFMAHEDNETFLNELTGEFNTAHFETRHHDILESQIAASESYLNEETGEISWNVLNKNIESGFFSNSERYQYDFDDSLNCDDLDTFPDQVNDVPSQYCLDSKRPNDWNPIEEACDTLLNECTGELVKKN